MNKTINKKEKRTPTKNETIVGTEKYLKYKNFYEANQNKPLDEVQDVETKNERIKELESRVEELESIEESYDALCDELYEEEIANEKQIKKNRWVGLAGHWLLLGLVVVISEFILNNHLMNNTMSGIIQTGGWTQMIDHTDIAKIMTMSDMAVILMSVVLAFLIVETVAVIALEVIKKDKDEE